MSSAEQQLQCLTASNGGMMTGNGTNTYLLGGGQLVIDPGPDEHSHVDNILNAADGNLKWILVTHTHRDHSPAAGIIAAETGAQRIGMPAPAEFQSYQDSGFRPDKIPEHDELLELGTLKIQAIHTPGHASNHFCYLDADTGTLFSGDHINQGTTVVIPPPDGSMRCYLNSLELLRHYPIRAIAPGHGDVISEPWRAISSLIRHRLQREKKTLRLLRALTVNGNLATSDLLPEVYDDVPTKMHPIAEQSLLAHLWKLQVDGLVEGSCSSATQLDSTSRWRALEFD